VSNTNTEKVLSLRLSKELWGFLKRQSIDQEKSMNEIIRWRLEKFKKSIEKSVDSK
jgi:hypothetical protein